MTQREYCHCIKCNAPMESPEIKRVQTVQWYLELAVCDGCKDDLLRMVWPSLTVQIDGECLKTLLKAGENQILVATVENG